MKRSVVLGVGVDPLSWPELREAVRHALVERTRTTILYANVHVVETAQDDAPLRAALRDATLVYCDGEGVRLASWLLGAPLPARMTAADFIEDLARMLAAGPGAAGSPGGAERAWSLYWVGGEPGVAAAALQILAQRAPGLRVAGAAHGYFAKSGPESDRLVATINASGADLVMVGMGTPVQEHWVAAHRAALQAPVVWCIGATADFITGRQRRGPPWMTRHGLEWLHRLHSDPRRLFTRYLVGNPRFAARVLSALARSALLRA